MTKEKIIQIVLIILFCIILSLPFLATIFHMGPQSQVNENRKLAEKPTFTSSTMRTFPITFQKYVNDTFAFRSQLIQLKNWVSIVLLKSSPKSSVIIGREGWFFFNSKGPLQKEKLFTNTELNTIQQNLEEVRYLLALKSIKFYVFITPDSQSIYPEYLPDYLSGGKTRFDQLISAFKNSDSPVMLVDPRQALLNGKVTHREYRKYDTHWNAFGAFVAYQELARVISHDFPQVHPQSLNEFTVSHQKSLNNDLLNILAISGIYQEDIPILKPIVKQQAQQTIISCRYRPNCEKIRSTITNSKLPKAVMYRDSFNISVIPYLSEHFREILYLWTHSMTTKDIETNKPDMVIFQVVERNLNILKDVKIN